MTKQLTGRQMLEEILALAAESGIKREDFCSGEGYQANFGDVDIFYSTKPNKLGLSLIITQHLELPPTKRVNCSRDLCKNVTYLGEILPVNVSLIYAQKGAVGGLATVFLGHKGDKEITIQYDAIHELGFNIREDQLEHLKGEEGEVYRVNANARWKPFARKMIDHYAKRLNPAE